MKQRLVSPWAQSPSDQRREPTGAELSAGFACGPADRELFNELMYRLSQGEAEIIKVIVEAGIVPDEFDLTQLWQALQYHFMRRYEEEIAAAGELSLLDLEPDSYYMIFTSANSPGEWTIHGSTDNGVTWRTDYQNFDGTETFTNAGGQSYQIAGEMDVISIWTGTDTIPGIFYRDYTSLFTYHPSSHVSHPRRFVNSPVGHTSALRLTTTSDFKVAIQKVM